MALLLRVYHFLLTAESTVETYGIKTSAESHKNILVKNLAAMSSSSESENATPSKRKNYNMHFKLEIVAYAEKYNKSKATKIKKVPRSCVKDWMKQKAQLEAHLKTSLSCSISSSKRLQDAGRPLKEKGLDEMLINWVRQQSQKKLRVSRVMIQRERRSLCHTTKISMQANSGWKSFYFVTTWSHAAQRRLVRTNRRSMLRRSLDTYCSSSRGVAPPTIHTSMLPTRRPSTWITRAV